MYQFKLLLLLLCLTVLPKPIFVQSVFANAPYTNPTYIQTPPVVEVSKRLPVLTQLNGFKFAIHRLFAVSPQQNFDWTMDEQQGKVFYNVYNSDGSLSKKRYFNL